MESLNPFDAINLNGFGTFRGVTLAPPVAQVQALMPKGLALGEHRVTPAGTHPVIISFNKLSDARMSVPSLLPTLNYREYTVGIPYSFVSYGRPASDGLGPFYYMPRLLLDSMLAVIGGVGFWGFRKEPATFKRGGMEQSILGSDGTELTSLAWTDRGEHRPVSSYEHFAEVRKMLDHPLVSQMPLGMGPFVVSDFMRQWDRATVRPIETTMTVKNDRFLPGCAAIVKTAEHSLGINVSAMGSYELRAPWRLGMPYVPVARAWR